MVNAEVILWGERVGALAWDERRNIAVFRYDDDFAAKGIELSPLMMPVIKGKIYEFPELRSNMRLYSVTPSLAWPRNISYLSFEGLPI